MDFLNSGFLCWGGCVCVCVCVASLCWVQDATFDQKTDRGDGFSAQPHSRPLPPTGAEELQTSFVHSPGDTEGEALPFSPSLPFLIIALTLLLDRLDFLAWASGVSSSGLLFFFFSFLEIPLKRVPGSSLHLAGTWMDAG